MYLHEEPSFALKALLAMHLTCKQEKSVRFRLRAHKCQTNVSFNPVKEENGSRGLGISH